MAFCHPRFMLLSPPPPRAGAPCGQRPHLFYKVPGGCLRLLGAVTTLPCMPRLETSRIPATPEAACAQAGTVGSGGRIAREQTTQCGHFSRFLQRRILVTGSPCLSATGGWQGDQQRL